MACSLTTRTAYLNIIISLKDFSEDKIANVLTLLNDYCTNHFKIYAYILHDRDLNEDNSRKTNHVHLVGIYNTNRQRLSTILSDLSCALCLNSLAISIDKCSDFAVSVQYLLHRNNAEKFQYQVSDIFTNLDMVELKQYLERESKSLSTSGLLDIITKATSKIDVYQAIGLEYYRQYRQVINDLWFEIHERDSYFACDEFMQRRNKK